MPGCSIPLRRLPSLSRRCSAACSPHAGAACPSRGFSPRNRLSPPRHRTSSPCASFGLESRVWAHFFPACAGCSTAGSSFTSCTLRSPWLPSLYGGLPDVMSDRWFAALQFFIALLLAPLLPAVVNRTKAVFAGRKGPPLMQGYMDLAKLLSKAAVYSSTTTWIFRAGPTIGLASVAVALAMLPWAGGIALVSFTGDMVLFATLFGLARFLTILAALDTGSAFEGMGASREAWFSALTEPALLLALAALARLSGSLSLSGILGGPGVGSGAGAALLLAAGAAFVVFLAEN